FIEPSRCTGCGLCGEICPFGLPASNSDGKFEISNPELCTECSACSRNCPTQAIIMQEIEGCGCLWNARARAKNEKKSCNCG
ncbi:MAG: 4Fe-4S binding protein, partial [Promethearchaeota archaeon]